MTHKTKTYLFLGLSWLALAPAAKAQWLCQVTVPAQHDTVQNQFLEFGCKGNYCTAAELENSGTPSPGHVQAVRLIFQRSNDGGRTWELQNPGIPLLYDNRRYINDIQQIDSLNAIAVGDSALVLRTNDGGTSWFKQNLPLYTHLLSVSFANLREGMIIGGDDSLGPFNFVYTTSDGGDHWSTHKMTESFIFHGRSYGNGKFRVYESYYGTIYSTTDYFQTIDSTKPIFDSALNEPKLLAGVKFGVGDTIFAHGIDYSAEIGHVDNPDSGSALIWRTTNAGKTWRQVLDTFYTVLPLSGVDFITDVDRDTILAGLTEGENNILISSDRGATWKIDTLIFNTTRDAYGCWGLSLTPDGNLVGVFGPNTYILFGQLAPSKVSDAAAPVNIIGMFPNPASVSTNIVSKYSGHEVHLFDILGREMLQGVIPANGPLTLNVLNLPRGIYEVMLSDALGKLIPVGKLAVQ